MKTGLKKNQKKSLRRMLAFLGGALVMAGLFTGCGKAAASANTLTFTKGVYVNYQDGDTERDYFYVFTDDNNGHTEDGTDGMGVPFACDQTKDQVTFHFGSADDNTVFQVSSVENGVVKGTFDDGKVNVFEPIPNVDPATFSGEDYLKSSGANQ